MYQRRFYHYCYDFFHWRLLIWDRDMLDFSNETLSIAFELETKVRVLYRMLDDCPRART